MNYNFLTFYSINRDLIGNRAPDKGVFYYNSFTGGNTIDNEVLPSPPTPVPSPFKFTWFNRDIDLVPPAAPDATTGKSTGKPNYWFRISPLDGAC